MSRASYLLVAAASLLLAAPLKAAEFRFDDNTVIAAEERVEGDLYAFGEKVTVDGVITGDLVAFGAEIRVNGEVEGDLIAAGQAVVIDGKVGDGARIAGQVLQVGETGHVTGDLVAAGFSLELVPGSTVTGDVVYAGFQALLAGHIDGKLLGTLANCHLSGETLGDVWLGVDGADPQPVFGQPPPVAPPSVSKGLTVADTAHIAGDFTYKSHNEANIHADSKIDGELKFEQQTTAPPKPKTPVDHAIARGKHFAALLIVGLAAVLLAPRFTHGLGGTVRSRFLPSLGWGVVALVTAIVLSVVILIAAVFLAIMAGAAGLGDLVALLLVGGIVTWLTVLAGTWFVSAYFGSVIAALAAGGLAVRSPSRLGQGLALVLGLIVVVALLSIPHAAGVIGLVISILGFGALWICGTSVCRRLAADDAPPASAPQAERPKPAEAT